MTCCQVRDRCPFGYLFSGVFGQTGLGKQCKPRSDHMEQSDQDLHYLSFHLQNLTITHNSMSSVDIKRHFEAMAIKGCCEVTVQHNFFKFSGNYTIRTTVPPGKQPKVQMSRAVRKPAFCICENKDADQLRVNREADQRLCFRYTDSTIHLLLKSEISSL